MKRKTVLLILVGIFALVLVACSSTETTTKESLPLQETIEKTEKEEPIPPEKIANIEIDEDVVVTLVVTEEPQEAEPSVEERTTATPAEKPVVSPEATQTTNPTESPQPTVTPELVITPTPIPQPTPEPAFNVNYWVEFGRNYGQSIGLQLDSSVTGSWDTPIGANEKCIYLERDIKDALNWYRNNYGFEYFWIWSEEIGENRYNIYIGYA